MAIHLIALLPKLAAALVTIFITKKIFKRLRLRRRQRALAKALGCLPAHAEAQHPLLLGFDVVYADITAIKEHRLLKRAHNILRSSGAHTVSFSFRSRKIFFTDEPENLKTVLATKFDNFGLGEERIKMLTPLVGKGIFTTDGAEWKHSRALLRPCFERSQVADVSLLEKHVQQLLKVIPKDGTTVDMQPLFHDLTMDIATEFLFGRSTGLLGREGVDPEAEEFKRAFEYCMNPFEGEMYKRWGFLAIFLPDREGKRCAKLIQAFATKLIDAEIASQSQNPSPSEKPSNRYILLHQLLTLTPPLPTPRLRSELLQILLAGRDTTSSLLSNTLFLLARNPPILAHLLTEISSHHPDNTAPTFESLKNMRYLQAVISESQRLYPIVPSNSREAVVDTTIPLGGGPDGQSPVFIPKGSMVAWHTYSLHRRTDVYGEDVEEFRPARWLDESEPLRPGWSYLPFNGGPRICIGQQFALTEVGYVLVRLLQLVGEVESRDEEEWTEKLTFVCRGKGGCKVAFGERSEE